MALKDFLNKARDVVNGVSPAQRQQRAAMTDALDKDDYAAAKAIEAATPGTAGLLDNRNARKTVMQAVIGNDVAAKQALVWNAPAFDAATSAVTEENATLKLAAGAFVAKGQQARIDGAEGYADGTIAPANIARAKRLSNEATDMAGQLENVDLAARAMRQRADLQTASDMGDPSYANAQIQSHLKQVDVNDTAARTKVQAAISLGVNADDLAIEDKVNLSTSPFSEMQMLAVNSLSADKVAPDDRSVAIVALAEVAQNTKSTDVAKVALDKVVDTGGKPENYNVIGNSYSPYGGEKPEIVETVIAALGNTLNNYPEVAKDILPDWQTTAGVLADINRFRGNEHQKAHGDKRFSEQRKDHLKAVYGHESAADMIAKNDESIPPLPKEVTIGNFIGDMGPDAASLRLHFAGQMQNELAVVYAKTDNRPRVDQVALAAQTARLNAQVVEDTLVDDTMRGQAKQNLATLIKIEDTQAFKSGNDFATIAAAVEKTPYYPSYTEESLISAVSAGAYDQAKTAIAPFANGAPINPDAHMQQHHAALQAMLQQAHATGIKNDLGKGRAELDRLLVSAEPVAREAALSVAEGLRQSAPAPTVAYAATVAAPDAIVPRLVTGRR